MIFKSFTSLYKRMDTKTFLNVWDKYNARLNGWSLHFTIGRFLINHQKRLRYASEWTTMKLTREETNKHGIHITCNPETNLHDFCLTIGEFIKDKNVTVMIPNWFESYLKEDYEREEKNKKESDELFLKEFKSGKDKPVEIITTKL